jgi:hypothetical protein
MEMETSPSVTLFTCTGYVGEYVSGVKKKFPAWLTVVEIVLPSLSSSVTVAPLATCAALFA